jgi:hypothetical protein
VANTESLIFDLLVRDRASDGLSKVGTSASSAAGNVDSLGRRLDDVGRKSVTARLQLSGDKDAQAALDRIDARLIGLDRRTSSPKLTVEGAARATAEVSALDLELDHLGKKGGSADVATGAVGSGGLAGPGGIMALVGAGVALAPVIVTTSVGLAGFGAAAAATVAPILAAGTATKAQQDALASLDPAQRAAYTSLGALKTQFGAFSRSLEPEVLGVFGQGLKLARGLLGDVQPVAAATGKALGGVVAEIGADLKTSQWQNFFGFMAATAGPDIKLLGNLFVSLMNDLPPLLIELQPLATGFLQVADAMAKAAGVAGAFNPNVNLNAKASDQANQANQGWLGTLEKLVNTGARMAGGTLFMSDSTKKAGLGIDGMGNSAKAAAPQVGTLSGDLAILNSSTRTATDTTKAFDDAWLQFVGKSVSDQQAVLTMAGAFDSYNQTLKTNKQDSTVAQQAFLSIITAMGSGLATLQQNGASVSTINGFYQVNIDRLKSLHNLTPAQRQDVQNITRDYDAWATSTGGLNSRLLTAAGTIKDKFTANLKALGEFTPGVTGDVNRLADSVLKTGTTSSATAGFRARLIADLKQAGLSGQSAAGQVDGLERKIAALRGKTVTVGVHAAGSGGMQLSSSGTLPGMSKSTEQLVLGNLAGGRRVPGYGGGDRWLAMLEGGELVVPKEMVRGGATDHLRGKIPGYAAGGVAGIPPWAASAEGGMSGSGMEGWATRAMALFQQQLNKAAALLDAPGAGAGVARWTGVVDAALAMLGLPLSLAGRVLFQMQTESGGNPRAINLSDFNATVLHDPSRGLMQVIGSTFAAYHVPGTSGDIYDPLANIAAAVHYGESRYGPTLMSGGMGIGSGHGYDNGGFLPPGLSLAYNGTGVPEPVIPAGRGGGSAPGGTTTIIVKVDPVIAAVTPDRNLGRQIGQHITAFIGSGGRLYPAGTVPR